ncbi:unnamed protein product [Rotaria sordida]|uniref:Tetratricopeptide repeat protein n=1 Tax=Rotaria sordida TaxID=392033 RepID=A0A819MPJ6_9BILA|nr:unnamed protein product [Rotaria sordida]
MEDYSNALSYYEKALKIEQKSLPCDHPSLAYDYNSIGSVYDSMNNYPSALSYYRKALDIQQKSLPPNHADLANTYNNIALVYQATYDYSTALSYYQKTLEMKETPHPYNQSLIATAYNNIVAVNCSYNYIRFGLFQWSGHKLKMLIGQVSTLEFVDNTQLTQSLTIARYLSYETGLAKNKTVVDTQFGCWCDINISVDQQGGYNISVNGRIWLRSAQTAIYTDDKWFSSADGSLSLINITYAQGNDSNLGIWNETQLIYDLVRSEIHTKIVGHIRQWNSISAITFHLNTGDQMMINTIPLDMEHVRTVFPSFYIEQIDENDQRGYFTFSGMMTGEVDRHAGNWDSSSAVIDSGMEGGPIVIFNFTQQGENDLLILSPFSQFMATSLSQTTNILQCGVLGSIISIPENYNYSMIIFYSSKGINEGIREWGKTMQQAYNRTNQYRLNDLTINYLGYYTDNGAYYYYNTEKEINYEETLINIYHQIRLPFHYIQLDSWWYYKGLKDGVSQWTARPDIFPDGLEIVHRRLENLPLAAHNRYWSYDTIYKHNYSFALDKQTEKALPIGNDSFWIDLFNQAYNWGLILYEQDWLNHQTIDFLPIRTDIHIGHNWLMSMGKAGEKLGINIQYCMSLSRHILQALEIPRVTQTRVSNDYALHLIIPIISQWNIGISSMFADAIGLAPFKDVFWSRSLEHGSPYPSLSMEILPDREILIATLSTGPVASGDGINYTNIERIMKCCRKDGLILKPDRPLTMINILISDWAFYKSVSQGELYSTRTIINNQTFHIIFASAMKRDYLIYPSMIEAQSGIIWSYNNANVVSTFDNTNPLNVLAKQCNDLSICLWYVSPLWEFNDSAKTKYAFLGEWNKWTAVSQQRIDSIVTNPEKTQTIITLQGERYEIVQLAVYHHSLPSSIINCQISPGNSVGQLVITPSDVFCR